MKRTILLLTVLILGISNVLANKDRIESPKEYIFIFENGNVLKYTNTNDSLLNLINDEIVYHKKVLKEVQLVFNTGEKMTFCYDKTKLKTIKIIDGGIEVLVPNEIIVKLKEIHFKTVVLLWHGGDKRAFTAGYFYIQFNVGIEKAFNTLPEVQLGFSNNKFSDSIIWNQVSENTKQWTKL